MFKFLQEVSLMFSSTHKSITQKEDSFFNCIHFLERPFLSLVFPHIHMNITAKGISSRDDVRPAMMLFLLIFLLSSQPGVPRV